MASAKKILASMRKNAKNWRIEDLQTLAKYYGIAYRQNGTSHVFFTFDPGYLPVPAHRPIKPVYVQQFVELLDARLADRKDTEG
jgi:hypothetical protein